MICLDTNYLIFGLVKGSKESEQIMDWYRTGEALVVPMPVWYEFLCGPIRQLQIEAMRCFLDEIIVFKEAHAEKAAELFELVGRKRSLKVDAMIAATSMLMKAPLATNNTSDFERFTQLGLQLYQA